MINIKRRGRTNGYLFNNLKKGELRVAPTGLYVEDTHYYEPDIFWVSPSSTKCFLRPDGHYWQGAPDLVVEVFSPGTASYDKKTKFGVYQKHGVSEYWMIDPVQEYIDVWRLNGDKFEFIGTFIPGDTFTSPLMPGHEIDVKALF